MDQALVLGLLRHVLQLGAGYMVGKGYLDADSATTAVGALLSLFSVGWFAWDRRKAVKP